MRMVRIGLPRLLSCYGCILRYIGPDVRASDCVWSKDVFKGNLVFQVEGEIFRWNTMRKTSIVEAWFHEPSGEKLINNWISQTVNPQVQLNCYQGPSD